MKTNIGNFLFLVIFSMSFLSAAAVPRIDIQGFGCSFKDISVSENGRYALPSWKWLNGKKVYITSQFKNIRPGHWEKIELVFTPDNDGKIKISLLSMPNTQKGEPIPEFVYFDSISIKGASIRNPSFENIKKNLPEYWAIQNISEKHHPSAMLNRDKKLVHQGTKSVRVWHNSRFTQKIDVTKNRKVRISAWVLIPGENKFIKLKAGDEYNGLNVAFKLDTTQDILPVNIMINENKIINRVNKKLLGHNWQWKWAYWNFMKRGTADYIDNLFIDLKDLPLPFERLAGADSQQFQWKKAVGPFPTRTDQNLPPGKHKKTIMGFGPVEWVVMCKKIDRATSFIYCLNYLTDSYESAGDLAEFFTGDGKSNPNGGINWAKKRMDCGLKDPVNIEVWELGNEIDLRYRKNQQMKHAGLKEKTAKYIADSKEFIKSIKKVHPQAKFAALSGSAPWGKNHWSSLEDWRYWHREILKEIGQDIDFITFHPYYLGLGIGKMESYIDIITQDIKEITGSDRITILLTEHSTWPFDIKKRQDWYKTYALTSCLGVGMFITRMLQRPNIAGANYHCISGGPWGLVYGSVNTADRSPKGMIRIPELEGKIFTTSMFDFFKTIYQGFGKSVVACSIKGEQTDYKKGDFSFSVSAMKTDKGLNLIIINRTENIVRKADFSFMKKYKLVKRIIFTGDSLLSVNDFRRKEVTVYTEDMHEKFSGEYIIAPRSMYILFLENINK
jgi:alpha-L-arabinofuranosidase